jgi:mRNA-degrading endonuclease HigB of HigAB toxin-antitoxin module
MRISPFIELFFGLRIVLMGDLHRQDGIFGMDRVYTLHVLTHKEYDKEKWKDDYNC